MERKLSEFIEKHYNDNTSDLLLGREKYPGIDVSLAVRCIEGRKAIRKKLPKWYAQPDLLYPRHISIEQCSSQATALYKERFVPENGIIADLTGGFGVDSYFLSGKAACLDYFEQNEELSAIAEHNFNALGAENITVCHSGAFAADRTSVLPHSHYDMIYIDPSRRSSNQKRVYSISECEPDIISLREKIFLHTDTILAKISPMADISMTLRELPQTSEIHILSHHNDCKELLLLLKRDCNGTLPPKITAVELTDSGSAFEFTQEQEALAAASYPQEEDLFKAQYLYEPWASILKGGAFDLISSRFGIWKISGDSHLYLSNRLIESFPGRISYIEETTHFSTGKAIEMVKRHPYCSVLTKNFPMTADQLRRRTEAKEGEEYRLIATTDCRKDRILILCRVIQKKSQGN